VALGDEQAVARKEAHDSLLRTLPADAGDAVRLDDLLTSLTGVKRTTAQEVLDALAKSGAVARTGAGKKGDPHRYYRIGSAGTTGEPAEPIR
jgi:hypothetical protein